MKPHHIGYLVKNMNKAIREFQRLGYEAVSEVTYDAYRDINICFLRNHGLCVELVEPVSERSVVYGMLKKTGAMPYHICYLVEDLAKEAVALRERGYLPMGEPVPAPALKNVPAAFYFNRQLGIIELISGLPDFSGFASEGV